MSKGNRSARASRERPGYEETTKRYFYYFEGGDKLVLHSNSAGNDRAFKSLKILSADLVVDN